MKEDSPSRTAWRVAARRAAHQLLDRPLVFDDPLAVRILGEDARPRITENADSLVGQTLRAFMAVRSRVAEDELSELVDQGVRQMVILGAGLDTFAYRNPFAGLRVFEVDHPATQAFKRHLLATAGIAIPESLTYVPIDFERQTLEVALADAGVRSDAPTFFSWLGVSMYLSEATVMSVLALVRSFPPPTAIVFDYAVNASELGWVERIALNAFARRLEAIGEPWTCFFEPPKLAADLRASGFDEVRDLGPRDLNARYFANRDDGLRVGSLGRIMIAARRAA
ncbi:MAG TPA: class I SAM-dependent methyltransferase [Vicinamibacterales bacterium]|nr:class I SAM-dependent methyltransferase [Vicinamibacterales bacterium]